MCNEAVAKARTNKHPSHHHHQPEGGLLRFLVTRVQSVMPIKKIEISSHLEKLKLISQEFQHHHEFLSWPSSYTV